MENLSPEQLIGAAGVILIIFGAIITIDKVMDIFRKWKAPTENTAKKLEHDNIRLDEHEKALKDMQASQAVLCSGILALLDHELHNGNADQIQRARDDIMQYLQGRGQIT